MACKECDCGWIFSVGLLLTDKLIFSREEMLAGSRGTSITSYLDSQDLMDTNIKRKEDGVQPFRGSQSPGKIKFL